MTVPDFGAAGPRAGGLGRDEDGEGHVPGVHDEGSWSTRTVAAGRFYEGEWLGPLANGRGRCTWPDGGSFGGEFQHGTIHGEGTCTWPSGRTCSGQWRAGKPHGEGTIIEKDGRIWHIGSGGEGSPDDASGSVGGPDDAARAPVAGSPDDASGSVGGPDDAARAPVGEGSPDDASGSVGGPDDVARASGSVGDPWVAAASSDASVDRPVRGPKQNWNNIRHVVEVQAIHLPFCGVGVSDSFNPRLRACCRRACSSGPFFPIAGEHPMGAVELAIHFGGQLVDAAPSTCVACRVDWR